MIVLEKAKVFSSCNITGGEKTMANSSNKKLVPEAMTALDKFKYEVASDVCVKKIFIKIFFTSEATSSFLHI